ncbi:hypothetical protein U1Q18_009907 [Sarracenia purpurea var. burkii]
MKSSSSDSVQLPERPLEIWLWSFDASRSKLCFSLVLGPRESGICYSGRTVIRGHAPLGEWGILSASFLLAGLLPPIR